MAGQPMSTLACILGDGIQSTELLGQLNVEHSANLILDIHHLRENWQKVFGPLYHSISGLLSDVVHARTDDEYDIALESLIKSVHSNSSKEYINKEIHGLQKNFCYRWIKSYPMNMGRLGDSGAEANHSSICHRISFGGYMEPVRFVTKAIQRNQEQAT